MASGRNAVLVALCCLVCVFDIALSESAVELPKGFVSCKKNDPNVNVCLQHASQSAIPHLVGGIPSLELIPIDPLVISQLDVIQGLSHGPIDIKINFRDLHIHNIRSIKITSIKSNFNNQTFALKADIIEPLVIEGLYKIQGNVIILPIKGEGKCNLTLAAVKVSINVIYTTVSINDDEYLELKSLDFKFSTSKLHIKLDNLFNGNKLLGNNMNAFLNRNWREILKEVQPAFESALGEKFQFIAQKFFEKVPYNMIFP